MKKVVKDCKKAHTRSTSKPKPRTTVKQTQGKQDKQEHVLGEKFAEATRKPDVDDEDSDVDLDFLPEEGTLPGFQIDPVNAHLSAIHVGAGLSPTRPTSIPLSSMSILQRTDRAPGPESDSGVPFVQTSATLPIHHNALSRVFVKTIGRLGRWKRVLNSRSVGRTPLGACADVSAFDLELTVSGDLLSVNGGVEQYLKMIEPKEHPSSTQTAPLLDISRAVISTLPPPSPLPHNEPPPDYSEPSHEEPALLQNPIPSSSPVAEDNTRAASFGAADEVELSDRPVSSRSSSTDSLGVPLTSGKTFPPPEQNPWQFDVVSIDELDLSDTSSDDHVGRPPAPPGLRKVPRRLPLRRDFEFVRRSESVSSMGIASHDSVSGPSSTVSSMLGLGGSIQQWQMNALVDSLSNDEETGDVEAALRRLEGQINPQKQQEKVSKVDGWVRTIQERMAAGDYGDDQPRFSDDEDEGGGNEESPDVVEDYGAASASRDEAVTPSALSISLTNSQHSEVSDTNNGVLELASSPIPTQTSHDISSPPQSSSPTYSSDTKPAYEVETQQGRVLSRPSTSSSKRLSLSNRFGNPEAPRVHRSYILGYRAEILAEHFSMIDRELFMGVKFEELVSNDWMACEEVNVLDWAQFLKDRALWKAESRWPEKTSALAALRARFNLIANFTLSEVVLTQPNERAPLVGKFIRIAWVSSHDLIPIMISNTPFRKRMS